MKFFYFTLLAFLVSCSSLTPPVSHDRLSQSIERVPAQETGCLEAIKNFFKDERPKTLGDVLVEKKLLTFTERKAQLHYPRLEWINRAKRSLNQSIRNWNNFRYPAFYTFHKDEIVPIAKRYAQNLEKILDNTVPLEDIETTRAFNDVTDWKKAYANYQLELDQLLEERISLQYNISMLQKIDLEDSEVKDVEITIVRGGLLSKEVISLRKDDKNLKATINKLKAEMKEFDGGLFSNGRIKDRIIRQAMLKDMLEIVHRELEYVVKNQEVLNDELVSELAQLQTLIKKADIGPSTYGLFKIDNKIFIREMVSATKMDKVYDFIKAPYEKIKNILSDYFQNKTGTEEQKAGLLKRLYTKITSITPKQAAIGGGSFVVGAIGYERYFAFKDSNVKEEANTSPQNELSADDLTHHQEQLEETRKVEQQKEQGHSSVIEVQIDELTK